MGIELNNLKKSTFIIYMFPLLFKSFVYINILVVICVSVFLMFSKKDEPKEFPEKFSKKYILKLPKL